MIVPKVATSRLSQLSSKSAGEDVAVDARVHSIRAAKTSNEIAVLLRDEDRFVTAFVQPGVADEEIVEKTKHLTLESMVRVAGVILPNQGDASIGAASTSTGIQVHGLIVVSEAKANLPQGTTPHGGPGEHSHPSVASDLFLSERLDNRVIDVRVAATAAIFKLFSGALQLCVEQLAADDFHWVPTPKLINYKIPGDDDYFSVPYLNDQQAWLTQTGEVHIGMALAGDLERVYDIHTVFRREEEVDARHLTEFTLIEVGFALKHGWSEVVESTERMIIFLMRSLQERDRYRTLLAQASRLYPHAGAFKLGLDDNGKLLRVTFQEAKQILQKQILQKQLSATVADAADFTTEEEAALGRYVASPESSLGPPSDVFAITHYPRHLRPYNYCPSADNPRNTTDSFDIIIRGQECATGLQLLSSFKDQRAAMLARKPPIDPDCPEWRSFTAAYEAGMPPYGGYGIGLNRFIQGYLGLKDIHETVLFPRDATRLAP